MRTKESTLTGLCVLLMAVGCMVEMEPAGHVGQAEEHKRERPQEEAVDVVHEQTIVVTREVSGRTPEVLAYNLGHFYPDSNAADWWRFAGVTGARAFVNPRHFEAWNETSPDTYVTDVDHFLSARQRLMDDPLNEAHIDWPTLRERLSTFVLPGSNRFVVEEAFRHITRVSPDVLVQMSVSPGSFPIADDDDWAGKWHLWRTYFSLVYYFAAEFGIERFAMHNEPNHRLYFVESDEWLMRAQLAADAAAQAMTSVNQRHDRSMRARMFVPVVAGNIRNLPRGAYAEYGRPVVQAWDVDFLGRRTGTPLYYAYAHQPYGHDPDGFAEGLRSIKKHVLKDLPEGMPRPAFSFTEFNIYTGRRFDAIPETMDSPAKVTRLAMILGELMEAGLNEFYLFKFGLTKAQTPGAQYAVHKNGMFYVDNNAPPHDYGGPTRGADAYRLFCRAFRPDRDRLHLDFDRTADFRIYASNEPHSGSLWLYAVNDASSARPWRLDASAWDEALTGDVIIEEVSAAKGGEVVGVHRLQGGQMAHVEQPPESVWLIHLPGQPGDAHWVDVPAHRQHMVGDGEYREQVLDGLEAIQVVNDTRQAEGRRVGLYRFALPEHAADNLLAAVVEFPVQSLAPPDALAQVQVFMANASAWPDTSVRWSDLPVLRQGVAAGPMLRNRIVNGQGQSTFIAGQLNVQGPEVQTARLDVTDALRERRGNNVAFLLAQEPRWDYNAAFPKDKGDVQAGGIALPLSDAESAVRLRLLFQSQGGATQ